MPTFFEAYCIICQKKRSVEMPYDPSTFSVRWDMWKNGKHIQQAFPELSPDQREAMLTGTCPACWRKIFPKEKK